MLVAFRMTCRESALGKWASTLANMQASFISFTAASTSLYAKAGKCQHLQFMKNEMYPARSAASDAARKTSAPMSSKWAPEQMKHSPLQSAHMGQRVVYSLSAVWYITSVCCGCTESCLGVMLKHLTSDVWAVLCSLWHRHDVGTSPGPADFETLSMTISNVLLLRAAVSGPHFCWISQGSSWNHLLLHSMCASNMRTIPVVSVKAGEGTWQRPACSPSWHASLLEMKGLGLAAHCYYSRALCRLPSVTF